MPLLSVGLTRGEARLLLVSAGIFHPSLAARWRLQRMLQALPETRVQRVRSTEELGRRRLWRYCGLVFYFHEETISERAVAAMDSFVWRGGGVLAVHCAAASSELVPRYFEILGGRYQGEGPAGSLLIAPCLAEDPIFAGIGGFEVEDTLYLYEPQPDATVHFQTRHLDRLVPVVWSHTHGLGRTCCVLLGHRSATLAHAQVKQILQRGLEWVCGGLASAE